MEKLEKKKIEDDWAKYKYCIMEKSYGTYKEISKNIGLKNYRYEAFIEKIHQTLQRPDVESQSINTLYHIWGYFKRTATEEEKNQFFTKVNQLKQGKCEKEEVKVLLYEYAVKYNSTYLLESHYFDETNKSYKTK